MIPLIVGILCVLVAGLRDVPGAVACTIGLLACATAVALQYPKRCRLAAQFVRLGQWHNAWVTCTTVPEYRARPGHALPIGENALGLPFAISLSDGNCLVGGVTGFGKSNLLRTFVKRASESSCSAIFLVDLKQGVDFSEFRGHSKVEAVATTIMEGRTVLERLRAEGERRLDSLVGMGSRDWLQTPEGGLTLLVVDEVAELLRDKKLEASFEWLVNRGRAAGIVVVAATQQPTTDVLPSVIRQGFPSRLALGCTSVEQARSILGASPTHSRFDATRLRKGQAVVLRRGKFHRVTISRAE
ncbi:FtsK/SpoIIIE domain-containing protein [Cryobacterium sp. M15]|uniref:FtsK/SpoIIIE domain-containing protein n=1 Tax=Cryobacterium sp. M15 TaxID=2048291 RepID=UPI0011B08EDC|nr:FtsK/SpoIIIE domain-containing protein [Cryobacterium sp. M15]